MALNQGRQTSGVGSGHQPLARIQAHSAQATASQPRPVIIEQSAAANVRHSQRAQTQGQTGAKDFLSTLAPAPTPEATASFPHHHSVVSNANRQAPAPTFQSAAACLDGLGPGPTAQSTTSIPSSGAGAVGFLHELNPPPPPGGPVPGGSHMCAAGFLQRLDVHHEELPSQQRPYRHIGAARTGVESFIEVGEQLSKKPNKEEAAAMAWELAYRRHALQPPPVDAAMSNTVVYCINLSRVQGLALPETLRQELDAASHLGEPALLSHKLFVSLIDSDRPSFFGGTWESAEEQLDDRQLRAATLTIEHDIDVFVHTRLLGPRCRAIVENCFVLRHAGRTTEYAGGWATLRPFERPDTLRDLMVDRNRARIGQQQAQEEHQMEQLFQGSPLALLQLPPHQTGGLRPGNGQLIFSVRQHRQLFSVLHLMPENGFFSCDRPLPGLLPLRDMRSGALDLSSLYQPTLQSPMPLSVAAVSIDYPHTLEEALTRALLEERGGSATAAGSIATRRQHAQQAATHFRVVGRRLLLGVHSGHVICAAPGCSPEPKRVELQEVPATAASISNTAAPAGSIKLRSVGGTSVSLDGFVLNEHFAVVMELQLDVLPADAPAQTRGGHQQPLAQARSFSVAWGCVVPYDAAARKLTSGHLQVALQFGTRRAPLTGAPLAGVLAPLAGGAEGGHPVLASLELRASHNWQALLRELSESDERDAAAALRPSAVTERQLPDGAEAEAMYRRNHFEVEEVRLTSEEATSKMQASLLMQKHMAKEDVLKAELAGQKAVKFWQGNGAGILRRLAFQGWALATKLSRSQRSAGHLEFQLHTLRVSGAARLPQLSQLWLELHPFITSRPQRTARVLRTADAMRVDFSERLDVLVGTPGANGLLQALQSARDDDSNVYISLHGASEDNTRQKRVAECAVSLKRMVAQGGHDLNRETFALHDIDGDAIAEVVLTIKAVDALSTLLSGKSRAQEERERNEALETGRARAKNLEDRRLQATATDPSKVPDVGDWTEPTVNRASDAPRSAAEAAMQGPTGFGAARSTAEQLASLLPAHASSGLNRAEKAVLWSASERLQGRVARDKRAVPKVLEEEEWDTDTVHNVLLQFVSYASAPGETPPNDIFLTFQFFHFEPHTTACASLESLPAAGVAAAAGGGGLTTAVLGGAGAQGQGRMAGRTDALRVDVGGLQVASNLLRDSHISELWVEIDLPGLNAPLRTKSVRKVMSSRVEFGYTYTHEVAAASKQEQDLQKALRSSDEQDADVYFLLKMPDARSRDGKELGQGFVNLREMLTQNADVSQQGLGLYGALGNVGTLTVSVCAVRAMRKLLGATVAAGGSGPTGGAAEFLKGLAPGAAAQLEAGIKPKATSATGAQHFEDLSLVAADPELAREGPGLVARFLLQPPAEGREGHADWDTHALSQMERFREYLRHKSLHVDVWDGTTLLQLGTARVPLAGLLRKSTEKLGHASMVKEYMSVDFFATQLTSVDTSPSVDATATTEPLLRGRLKLVLARLSAGTRRAGGGDQSRRPLSARDPGVDSRTALGTQHDEDAHPSVQKHKVRLRALPSDVGNLAWTGADETTLHQRQVKRERQREWLKQLHLADGKAFSASTGRPFHDFAGRVSSQPGSLSRSLELPAMDESASLSHARLQLQQRQLRATEQYRQEHREQRLTQLMQYTTQLTRYIYPSYGSVEFIELPFRNPYGIEHCFTVEWDDLYGHLSLVTSVDEWRALKVRHNLNTPAEEELVLQGQRLWLMPQELVYIPIKFQAWQHGAVLLDDVSDEPPSFSPGELPAKELAALPIARRTIGVNVLNVKQELVTSLELRVRPLPFVIDQTFRFHQSENEFLKTTVRLQGVRWHASGMLQQPLPGTRSIPPRPADEHSGDQPVWTMCSDPDVVTGVHEQCDATSPLEVSIKYRCGSSPGVSRFFVLVYADVWQHRLLETWELIVHALQRIDVDALVGQVSHAKVLLKGPATAQGGLVQCFSSKTRELRIEPAAPFNLAPGALNELALTLRPTHMGRKQYVVHAVDLNRGALLAAWLVNAVQRLPAVTKAFSLTVPHRYGASKKVSLSNPYTHDVHFVLSTDRPDLLSFKQPTLPIPAGETRYIGLKFVSPAAVVGSDKLFVFVNNEEDKNEELMEITVVFSDVGAASEREATLGISL